MVIHPPMLYMGYVGFSVAFAFAIAALLGGRLDATWARWSRPWTTVAWAFLTIGIALGSGWAYYTLGWGGWWFWDPVENASFMPWLTGTALIHSLAVTEKRGAFKSWTVLLAIVAFSLSLLGTFLVRSGVLTSVHAFATDPARGVFILTFLALVVGGSLALFAYRAGKVGLGGVFGVVSRESALLANNILLIVAMASVLLGTLYPLFLDALNLGKISVGPPYFDAVFYPLLAPAVFLMGIGPMARWSHASLPEPLDAAALGVRGRRRRGPGAAVYARSLVAVDRRRLVPRAVDRNEQRRQSARSPGELAPDGRARQARRQLALLLRHAPRPSRRRRVHRRRHAGQGLPNRAGCSARVGQSVAVGGYEFRFLGVHPGPGPNYRAVTGTVEVRRDGRLLETLHPEKRIYNASGQAMTIAAIDVGVLGDRYVSLGEPLAATMT